MLPSPGNTHGSASLGGMKELNNGKPLSPPTTIVNQSKPPSPWLVISSNAEGSAVSLTPHKLFMRIPTCSSGAKSKETCGSLDWPPRRLEIHHPLAQPVLVCVTFSRAKAKASPRGALSPASECATCTPPQTQWSCPAGGRWPCIRVHIEEYVPIPLEIDIVDLPAAGMSVVEGHEPLKRIHD